MWNREEGRGEEILILLSIWRTVVASENRERINSFISVVRGRFKKKKKTYLKRKSVISSRAPNELGFWVE